MSTVAENPRDGATVYVGAKPALSMARVVIVIRPGPDA